MEVEAFFKKNVTEDQRENLQNQITVDLNTDKVAVSLSTQNKNVHFTDAGVL